jgi:hypothetical protein
LREEIDQDLGTLTLFRTDLGYQRAIYLIYGTEALEAAAKV